MESSLGWKLLLRPRDCVTEVISKDGAAVGMDSSAKMELSLHREVLGSQVQGLGRTRAGTLIARWGWHPGDRKAVPSSYSKYVH